MNACIASIHERLVRATFLALINALTHSYWMDIVDDIIRVMRERGFNPTSLARKAGVPQATVSRTLRRVTTPELETLQKLCVCLGLPAPMSTAGVMSGSAEMSVSASGTLTDPLDTLRAGLPTKDAEKPRLVVTIAIAQARLAVMTEAKGESPPNAKAPKSA